MAAKFTRLTHKIAIQPHLVAESCILCSSRSRRPVRKLLDRPSCIIELSLWCVFNEIELHIGTQGVYTFNNLRKVDLCLQKMNIKAKEISQKTHMARPRVADTGDDPQIWKVPADSSNNQSRIADKWWTFILKIGQVDNKSSPYKYKTTCYEMLRAVIARSV
jgi:hypothetical protein